jgi:hypothetical protein
MRSDKEKMLAGVAELLALAEEIHEKGWTAQSLVLTPYFAAPI